MTSVVTFFTVPTAAIVTVFTRQGAARTTHAACFIHITTELRAKAVEIAPVFQLLLLVLLMMMEVWLRRLTCGLGGGAVTMP